MHNATQEEAGTQEDCQKMMRILLLDISQLQYFNILFHYFNDLIYHLTYSSVL